MHISTTPNHTYKTQLHQISAKSQKQNSKTTTKNCKTKKRTKNAGTKKTPNFEEKLLESIDDGLAVLGESTKQIVYFHLEKTFKIERENIPYRIEEFTDILENIFGTGAKIIEIQIMKSLFKKFRYSIKNYSKQNNLSFIEYVAAVKQEKKKRENKEKQSN
ncbi:MAG: hypothetical protein NWF06_05775 [Candidatus Bathyarchaeota archaeon]|nr:hypothetical protein [Candidatus Bathyarchaeum sp.]